MFKVNPLENNEDVSDQIKRDIEKQKHEIIKKRRYA